MPSTLTIGRVARSTGVPVRTIRFYEAVGVLPPPARTASGYRAYTAGDIRRLRLVRNAGALGLGLAEIRTLVAQAFASDCRSFAPQLSTLIARKRADAEARISELRLLQAELDDLERHVAHAACATRPGRMVADCDYCPMIDEEEDPVTNRPDRSEILDVLACDIDVRPREAPTLEQLAPSITAVSREEAALVVEFDAAAADRVARFVAAEQRCCSSIGWRLETQPALRLRIEATPAQLDALQSMYASA